MKRVILPVLILAIAGVAAYFLIWNKDGKKQEEEKQQPLTVEENTTAFNKSYNKLLAAYEGVKDALVAGDTAAATASARELVVAADSLKVDEIKGDSTGTIKSTAISFTSSISEYARSLAAGADITAKRKEFEMISDALWNLTRTVKYDGRKVYLHYCSMAFKRGASWMSEDSEKHNPFFGNNMLECVALQDSLDFSAKN